MPAWVLVALGGLMTLAGGIWALQGLGYLEGSSMTDSTFWAVVGPIVAGFGLALMIVGMQRGRR
jgi:hypothetical protein